MAKERIWLMTFLTYGILVRYCKSTCSLTPVADKRSGSMNIIGGPNVTDQAECEAACLANMYCLAADYNTVNTDCLLVSDTPTSPYNDDNDFVLLIRNCDSCSMTRTENTKGSTTVLQFHLINADLCGSACLSLQECTGVRYAGGSCSIYDGTPSDTNSGDSLTQVKTTCSGKQCCFEGTSTLKASATALATLTASLESCETACTSVSDCHSVYFRDNVCYMYTSAPETTAETGSTYSVKSCTGSPTYDLTSTSVCFGSGVATLLQNKILVLVPVLLWLLVL